MTASSLKLAIAITATVLFKILLFPVYHSTDFEVHRNWLAITNSLPLNKWYFENSSEWTLDYPPFFAYFEYALSHAGKLVDKNMTMVENLNYKSPQTIIYQRSTVIFSELVFLLLSLKFFYFNQLQKQQSTTTTPTKDETRKSSFIFSRQFLIVSLNFLNFGLIIVDNIHFQYNGFLFGIQILSIFFCLNENWMIGAFLFSSLINLKHIYLYVSPAYFLYIFFYYCLKQKSFLGKIFSLVKIGLVTIIPFILSIGPFLLMNQLPQLLSRLFPFKRGLCHAYWAPNFWSLYNFADRFLLFLNQLLIKVRGGEPAVAGGGGGAGSSTSGLVQDIEHKFLFQVPPMATFFLSFLFMIIPILKFIISDFSSTTKSDSKSKSSKKINHHQLIIFILICAYSSFLFGWHVHEKAVLLITIPMSLLALQSAEYANVFFFLSTISNYSLFPLIFRFQEYPIKVLLFLLSSIHSYSAFRYQYKQKFKLMRAEKVYLFGILLIELYNVAQYFVLNLHSRFPFIPLMITSVYCSLGVFYSWIRFLNLALFSKSINH